MKNLKLYSEITFQLELQSKDEILTLSALDIERNRLFFASSANVVYISQIPSFQKETQWHKTPIQAEVETIDLTPGDSITALDYLMEKEALIVGTSNGDLLLHIKEEHLTEVVGIVEGGVKSIAPSPDGAVLAVITGFGQILVMTHDWEVLYENTLNDLPEDVDGDRNGCSGHLFESAISWRGDGKYFATVSGANNSCSSQKKLKIWERDSGVLQASSETKAFMGAALDWMPSGAKVATAYDRKADKKCPSIVFYERNGLERNSFSIDDQIDGSVEILKWNCNSDLLATVVRCKAYDSVKIWSFSNNHWYLKQEMRYSSNDRVNLMWDPTKPFSLICWTTGGKITTYNFVWVTSVMENSTAFVIDNSKILVSPLALSLMPPPMCLFSLKFQSPVQDMAFVSKNSRNLLAACLSNGTLCILELPDSDTWEELEGKEFSIEASSSEVTFESFRHLIWLDSHILLGVSYFGSAHRDPSLEKSSSENGHFHDQGMNHSRVNILQEIEVVCSENLAPDLVSSSGWRAKVSHQIYPEGPVIGIAPNPAKGCSAFVQLDGGAVIDYTSKLGITKGQSEQYQQRPDYNIGFATSCPWMNGVTVRDSGILKSLLFGLDSNSRLNVSGKVLCNNCSSFSFYSNSTDQLMTHLVLTTNQDLLFVIDIDDILHGNPEVKYENFVRIANKKKEVEKNSINIWERGAKLVGVLHGDEAALVLQTTRGNLECIYPRKLVLESIVNALVQRRFRDALLLVRRHRIDFNVIVDYCGWEVFIQSAKEFVQQVNNLSHITEFICSIKNENVMETLYRNILSLPCSMGTNDTLVKDLNSFDAKDKVSSILIAIRNALEEQVSESPARELCILTTLARSEPPLLEESLKRIKVIREMELSGVDDPRRKSYPSAEEALKHLLWLSDSEAVFEAALGLYDLHLAAIVALNSQRDPKEFLPFLQGLERMQPAIMQYTIDLKLHRYETALKHIVSAGDAFYEDSMNLMKNNPQLFPLGLQLFTNNLKRRQVLEAWGDHLNAEKLFEDAATTYLCCPSLEKALKAYRDCGNWKGVFTVAGLLNLGKKEVLELAVELCEELHALGKPAEAAKIALEYCDDVVNSVGYFVSAREWEEALRVGFMHRRDDLISEVKSAAMECASTLVIEYEEGLEKVGKYLIRYLAVRQRRLVLAAQLQLADKSIDDIEDDAASESSSNFSGMSAYTKGTRKGSNASVSSNATSKGRDPRRKKHKGGKIRAGSPGEEMALVDHLKSMALTTGAQLELKSLIVTLLTLNEEDTARKLQRAGDSFQISQRAAVRLAEDTIFNDNMDEKTHTLDHYIQKVRGESPQSDSILWQSKVLLPA